VTNSDFFSISRFNPFLSQVFSDNEKQKYQILFEGAGGEKQNQFEHSLPMFHNITFNAIEENSILR